MFISFHIRNDERGLLYRNGRLVEWLEPGRHRRFALFWNLELQRHDASVLISPYTAELAQVVPERAAQEILFVAKGQLGLVIRNGIPDQFLQPGRYLIWRVKSKVEVRLVSAEAVQSENSDSLWNLDPSLRLERFQALPFERSFLYLDGLLIGIVRPGVNKYQQSQRLVEGWVSEVCDSRRREPFVPDSPYLDIQREDPAVPIHCFHHLISEEMEDHDPEFSPETRLSERHPL